MRVESAPRPTVIAGVVRVSTFRARAGQSAGLVDAAEGNACDARAAAGCLSADVCTAPGTCDTVLVISRWESASALHAFLHRHERHAHDAVSPYASAGPRSVHYPVTAPRTPAVLPSPL